MADEDGNTGKLKLEDPSDIAKWVYTQVEDSIYESPIDVSIGQATEIDLPPLVWKNFELIPKKMKLTNTGHTIILSGKWYQERPYITGGPLVGAYVFSQLHLHWGANDMEGSEHSVDGEKFPLEMHAIFFRSCYLTQEAALKERDGVVVLAYFFQLHNSPSTAISIFTEKIKDIEKPFTSTKVTPRDLNGLLTQFKSDYLAYWGSISSSSCVHYLLWLICRQPSGVTADQVKTFRTILDENGEPVAENHGSIKPLKDRPIYLVCPSSSKDTTLLELTN